MRRVGLIILPLLCATPALGQVGTYSFSGRASGLFSGSPFSDAAFTLALQGDLANIEVPIADVFVLRGPSASIDIAGIGFLTFITPVYLFVNRQVEFGGVETETGGDVLLITAPAFSFYDLSTSLAPVHATSVFTDDPPRTLATSGGALGLYSAMDVTFTASVPTSTIPEPLSIALLGTGLAGLAAARRLRRDPAARLVGSRPRVTNKQLSNSRPPAGLAAPAPRTKNPRSSALIGAGRPRAEACGG